MATTGNNPAAGNPRRSKSASGAAASAPGNEIHALRQHVDSQVGALRAEVNAVRTEMKGEIATVMATIQTAEAQRSIDFTNLTASVDATRTSLPSTKTMWRIVGTTVGGAVALLALLWTVFGAGISTTGMFAEKVLEQKQQQANIDAKLNRLLERLPNDNTQGSSRARQSQTVPTGAPERPAGGR